MKSVNVLAHKNFFSTWPSGRKHTHSLPLNHWQWNVLIITLQKCVWKCFTLMNRIGAVCSERDGLFFDGFCPLFFACSISIVPKAFFDLSTTHFVNVEYFMYWRMNEQYNFVHKNGKKGKERRRTKSDRNVQSGCGTYAFIWPYLSYTFE